MRERSFFEKIIYLLYGLMTDYFLAMGAYLYAKFTLNTVNQSSIMMGLFWSFFIIAFLEKALTNKMVKRGCYGKRSTIISIIIRLVIIVFFALTMKF